MTSLDERAITGVRTSSLVKRFRLLEDVFEDGKPRKSACHDVTRSTQADAVPAFVYRRWALVTASLTQYPWRS